MIHHYNYLKYVLVHKWYVFLGGLKLKVPLWQLIIHDLSKFSIDEWKPYVDNFFVYPGRIKPLGVAEAFQHAWNHHQKVNKHHWQYYYVVQDNGEQTALEMPEKYVLEMIADWYGAGYAKTGKNDVVEWWKDTGDTKIVHKNTRALINRILERYFE